MDTFIPKEKLTAYERWELAAFDEAEQSARKAAAAAEAPPASVASEPPAPPLPDPAEIERQIQEALTQAREAGHADGYRDGYAQGEAAGREAGLAEMNTATARLAGLADSFLAAMRPNEAQVAGDLLELALQVARQVIRTEIRSHPEWLLDVIREAMLALPSQHGHPTLYVNPSDAVLVRERLAETLAHTGWKIAEDPTIEPGGCRIENGPSEVDATLVSRWRRVVETIGTRVDWHDGTS